jgi:hypothetical protein
MTTYKCPRIGKKELASYRQISLLPIVSKIIEKLLLTRILPIIEKTG